MRRIIIIVCHAEKSRKWAQQDKRLKMYEKRLRDKA